MEHPENAGTAAVVAELMTSLADVVVMKEECPITKSEAIFAVVPEGKTLQSLDGILEQYRPRPTRRKGIATLRDIKSFIAHVNRFKDADSAIFANDDPKAPGFLAVYDYHPAGGFESVVPRFGQHRAQYRCELSEPWKAWTAIEGKEIEQGTFAAFIEDRIGDVCLVDTAELRDIIDTLEARVGGPSSLLALSRGLAINVNTAVTNAVTLSTGEVKINFAETQSADGGGPITTPNLFFLNIPVFVGGEGYQVPVRLRYRLAGGKLLWKWVFYRGDQVFDAAFKGMVDLAAQECELPVFRGGPEA